MIHAVCLTLVLLLIATCAVAQPAGFKLHGSFTGIGACLNTIVGPGPGGEGERIYASHIYSDTFDVIAIDPATWRTDIFTCPLSGECGAWALVLGPDRQVYVGSLPRAHVWRVDWKEHRLVDMGQPSPSEQYIWQLAVGADGKLYGCTFPNAKLVRFDPATGKGEDLGRMSETENYARSVAADGSGFVYVGIGTSTKDLVAYEIATGRHQSVLPRDLAKPGTATVWRGADGNVYANVGKLVQCHGLGEATEATATTGSNAPALRLSDGRAVRYQGKTITFTDALGKAESHDTDYKGKAQSIFRLGLGPDGRLYGSTAMPIHFFWADADSDRWEEIAIAGGGEFYSFTKWHDRLIGAAYSADAPVIIYDPSKPWRPGPQSEDNPWRINWEGANAGWRPKAMINGPQDKVYIGAVSGYGLLGGPIVVLDPRTGQVEEHMHVVKDHSVVALAALPNGLIVAGTSIGGGGGSHPTQSEAKLVLWSPRTRKTVFETVPVPGMSSIEAVAVGRDGLVYGFAGDTMFVFSVREQKVIATVPNRLGGVTYNSVVAGPDGTLYGLYHAGIFRIDEQTHEMKQVVEYAPGISAGIAMRGREVFFASGPQIVSYTLP